MDRRELLKLALGSGLLLPGCGVKTAQPQGKAGFPKKPVEWVVPFAPGGSTDLIARMLAKQLEEPLGQTVVVINRSGAAGAVGTKEVLAAPPDGYTMVFPPSSLFTITPLVQKGAADIPFDTMRIITGLTVESIVLLVHKDSPYQSINDLVADKGAKLTYSHSGVGTGAYLSQTLFYKQAGFRATDVPYGGSGPAVTALLGKQVDIAASQIAESHQHVANGDLRRLAIFSEAHSPFLPLLPTVREVGVDVVVDQMRFIATPAQVPDSAVAVLEEAFKEAVRTADYGKFLNDNYIERRELAGPELIALMKAARHRYQSQMDKLGVAPR